MGKLIQKSKIAKCLESARRLIVDKNESHFDEVTPISSVAEVKTEIALYENRPVDKVGFQIEDQQSNFVDHMVTRLKSILESKIPQVSRYRISDFVSVSKDLEFDPRKPGGC